MGEISKFYDIQLLILSALCLLALVLDRFYSMSRRKHASEDALAERAESGYGITGTGEALATLTKQYLIVYSIVMGADWLQGPYIYSLYHEQYAYTESTVALLFVVGFVSAALAAPLVGSWADQHGRKRMCLIFCAVYTTACICTQTSFLPALFLGRVVAGFATSILFSAFEAWLISAASAQGLHSSDLSTLMGRATLVNGIVATGAGVASNQLVAFTHSFASPFILSGGLLVVAWLVIRATWTENYGNSPVSSGGEKPSSSAGMTTDRFQIARLGTALRIVRDDTRLLVLGTVQTCFEGSMYLFVFLWVPALQQHSTLTQLPLGFIFSSFMLSMMLGSLLYTFLATRSVDSSILTHAKLSSCVCAVSGFSLAASASIPDERVRFWAFCLFECCVGMYFPVQGMLRSALIADSQRATLGALFRVPLNLLVVGSLLGGVGAVGGEGGRGGVMTACSLMLCGASILVGVVLVGRADKYVAQGNPVAVGVIRE
ncbi:unnamed protein product [Mycena citricolor]|uniref:Molybdate-anion transporter n=1 Tax=Mycena citricolor TaxID=2018698 RepID=A0AAD2HEZ1_9AGAR|nr:unnamed protein product [Mycena citricolor]CAK5262278.1 unnamed protein product [Mycena citricolor]CAK5274611.1 unnamed protein product [Mycena citricolor]